jgi:3-methyl-2-oxobutanoate hydroxymethyltransferase
MPSDRSIMTVPKLVAMKAAGEKITMLTAYDFPTARLVDEAGVDVLLVGDSLGTVVQGRDNTLPVTLDEVLYHAEMVGRAAQRALVVVDMPFPTFHLGKHRAIENASRVLKETQCRAVKIEGGARQVEVIDGLVTAGIPVMAHIGLRPQSIHQLGGYRVERDREQLLADAQAVQDAGAFSVVLECVPAALAGEVTAAIEIPTIGIGAGPRCDGQVLVLHDLLGLTVGRVPRHVKTYADLATTIRDAAAAYCQDVRSGAFPTTKQAPR